MGSKLCHRESSNVQLKKTWWLFNQMVHDTPFAATTTITTTHRLLRQRRYLVTQDVVDGASGW